MTYRLKVGHRVCSENKRRLFIRLQLRRRRFHNTPCQPRLEARFAKLALIWLKQARLSLIIFKFEGLLAICPFADQFLMNFGLPLLV
jgi:hypothetical protein